MTFLLVKGLENDRQKKEKFSIKLLQFLSVQCGLCSLWEAINIIQCPAFTMNHREREANNDIDTIFTSSMTLV